MTHELANDSVRFSYLGTEGEKESVRIIFSFLFLFLNQMWLSEVQQHTALRILMCAWSICILQQTALN